MSKAQLCEFNEIKKHYRNKSLTNKRKTNKAEKEPKILILAQIFRKKIYICFTFLFLLK